jgi:hypothetical protein
LTVAVKANDTGFARITARQHNYPDRAHLAVAHCVLIPGAIICLEFAIDDRQG